MPTLGSSTNPSWAGWYERGVAGYEFASNYTTPNYDILITAVSAFFDASGTHGHGHVVLWDVNGNVAFEADIGSMALGSNTPGGQQWYTATANLIWPANSSIWIGGWSAVGIVFSTYDTSPTAYVTQGGSSGASKLSPSSIGQGPVGGYVTYSQIIKGAPTLANRGAGLVIQQTRIIFKSGVATLANRAGSGLSIPQTKVLNPTTVFMGGNDYNGLAVTGFTHQPTIYIWRPR